jgi:phosphoglycerate dehydrogenase-like enzyme
MNVLVITPVSDEALERIASVDQNLKVVDARNWFNCEIRDSYPEFTLQRYLGGSMGPESTREERDKLLTDAEILLGRWPLPMDLVARAPNLRWYHQLQAGASNMLWGDMWGSRIIATTSRGYVDNPPMAEYVLASFFHFARGLHLAYRDRQRHRFDHRTYKCVLLTGKTVCVVGAGGIGMHVARMCAGMGMRVVGTRRSGPTGSEEDQIFDRLEGPDRLHELLGESEFVAICCQWTPETTNLIGKEAFAAMKPGSVLVNVARGEIIDEEALVRALAENKLSGVALDVYTGEFEHEPDRRLWDHERVIITPHVSIISDRSRHRGMDLFIENLKAYLEGRPLTNVVDWERGY